MNLNKMEFYPFQLNITREILTDFSSDDEDESANEDDSSDADWRLTPFHKRTVKNNHLHEKELSVKF